MASSPTPTPSVDPESPLADVADPIVRYSPVALVIDVVRLLRGRGLAVADTYDHLGDLVHTSADLLRRLGVTPQDGLLPPPPVPGPALIAAATLMRAAGIEPDAVLIWPRQGS